MKAELRLIRSLMHGIRSTTKESHAKDNIMVRYIMEQARAHKETSETLCKAREELTHLADTYNFYLGSQKLYNDIIINYGGKGERSVRETADLVGFKLPHDPQ
ncbi:protein FMC1 homolog [Aphidius gifuensis]|uniref:protein FMC1 homolog n=1 Tax=Aphidius gifuensis TaxID=684658 RepID=UPI001CDC2798|nr:protein FMC1 homolog [Aphidius gifuensis]XP_044002296.1 protein FMC1 homolog [Aphidius gifuensis]